jgi:hypothetical protein
MYFRMLSNMGYCQRSRRRIDRPILLPAKPAPIAPTSIAPFLPETSLSVLDSTKWNSLSSTGEAVSPLLSPPRNFCIDNEISNLLGLGDTDPLSNQDYGLFTSRPSPLPHPMSSFSFSLPQDFGFNASVTFSYYRFLKLDKLSNIPPEDVRFLETKGCLHVPSGDYLEQFVRQYFLHVHPCMPILDEAEFWELYSGDGNESGTSGISLLVFQAMLFAASTVRFHLSSSLISPSTEESLTNRSLYLYRC